jgi:hypothetical protein
MMMGVNLRVSQSPGPQPAHSPGAIEKSKSGFVPFDFELLRLVCGGEWCSQTTSKRQTQ